MPRGSTGGVLELIKEFFSFAKSNKKYILIPLIVVVIVVGVLVLFTQGSVIAPFVYTIF